MKKTTLALLTSAFLANTASAYTIANIEETGTKIDFSGSARVQWRSTANKTSPVNGETTRNHVNQTVRDNGSRFGFKITQQLGDGFYALGRVEWRFQDLSSSQHGFDHVYDRLLYAGVGHKKFGELTYGNMTTITDEVKQTDLPNTLSLSDGLLAYSARHAVQYTYSGIEGLKAGAFYAGHSQRGANGLDLANQLKDVWGFGSIYNYKFDDKQSLKSGIGFTRERFEQANRPTYDRNAYSLGLAYTYDKTTLGMDLERRVTKDQNVVGNKRIEKEVRTVAYHKITDDWRAYTMYAYTENKLNAVAGQSDTKRRNNQFMIGSEYYVVKNYLGSLSLKGFLEWQTNHIKNFTNGQKTNRVRDNVTVVGVRAYW